jgi:putative ABC transport system permease protein
MSSWRWIGRDLRYAVRSLLADRGSVALAVLALALGIGAATVIFSVVYSVFVDSFPFKEPSRVVHFYIQTPEFPSQSAWYPAPEFEVYRAQNQVFSDVLGGASMEVLYNLDNRTFRVRGAILDPHALRALGVTPVLGRDMTDADGALDAPPTFYLSNRLWREQFNGDPSVLGMHLNLNGTVRTLIGILPPRFSLHAADVFFPTTVTATSTSAAIGGGTGPLSVWTYARLKPGVTPEQASANLEVIAHHLADQNPRRYPEHFKITIMSLANAYTSTRLKDMLYILVGAVSMLLMIACSNVANLLLVRSTAREPEFALRASLGAPRSRLMQQLLAESFVLAASGTIIGAGLAVAGLRWVKAAIPANNLPSEMAINFSNDALLATVAVALLTTVLCGIVPAFRAARGGQYARLTGTGKGIGLRGGRGWLRSLLVGTQVALAIVLLVGAGLMMRTLLSLEHVDLGVDASNVLLGRLSFPVDHPPAPAARQQFVRELDRKLAAIPGVVAASPAVTYPLRRGAGSPLTVIGVKTPEDANASLDFVGADYFRAIGVPLVTGRVLSEADIEGARSVAVVNRRFVRDYLGDASPIGRTLTLAALDRGAPSEARRLFEIVGVVGDTRNSGLEQDIRPEAFLPYTVPGFPAESLIIRTAVDPLTLQQNVRQQVWSVNPGVALMNVMSLEDMLHQDALAQPRFGAGLLATFGVIGLVLAAIGVFSVTAYTVSLETRNVGIRMALGSESRAVLRLIVVKGLRPILAGVVAGAGASYGLSRLMSNQIFGITATDPWTFAIAVVVLVAVGLVACVLPARRATKVSPLMALRNE